MGLRGLARSVLDESKRAALVPALRMAVRHAPSHSARVAIWKRLVGPHFSWVPHPFEVRTLHGPKIIGSTDDFIQRHIYYFGVWEPHLTSFIARRLRLGDTFVDVGANIGYFTLEAAKLVGSAGRVVAIEASPSIFSTLERNIQLNGARNVRAVNVAASDTVGDASVYRGPSDNTGGTTLIPETTPGAEFECHVRTLPLKEIVTGEEWGRTRMVKIDVEGAEAEVTRGLKDLLSSSRPDLEIIVEINAPALERQGQSAAAIFELFANSGFNAFRLENNYSSESYIPPIRARAPERIRSIPTALTDVVFSRTHHDTL